MNEPDDEMARQLEESARQRAAADYRLVGRTAENRRISARIQVKVRTTLGQPADQWVIDVAEGRLPV
ncbi:MAG: hypothetical protein QM658_03315 [Gordonia sp. (in: high G+C Gram-positive bacteria)]